MNYIRQKLRVTKCDSNKNVRHHFLNPYLSDKVVATDKKHYQIIPV